MSSEHAAAVIKSRASARLGWHGLGAADPAEGQRFAGF